MTTMPHTSSTTIGDAASTGSSDGCVRIVSGSGYRYVTPFPWQLHQLLCEAKDDSIVTWLDGGKCFRVNHSRRFIQDLAPRFFKLKSYKSFQRQLYLYGFQRIAVGEFQGAYYNPNFLRSDRERTHKITRSKTTPAPKPWNKKSKKSAEKNLPPPLVPKHHISTPLLDSVLPRLLPKPAMKPETLDVSLATSKKQAPTPSPLFSFSHSGGCDDAKHFESQPLADTKCIYDDQTPVRQSISSFPPLCSLNQSIPMPAVFSVSSSENPTENKIETATDSMETQKHSATNAVLESDPMIENAPRVTPHFPFTKDLRRHANDIIALFGSSIDGEPIEESDIISVFPDAVDVPNVIDAGDELFFTLCERISRSVSDSCWDDCSEVSSISLMSFPQ